MIQRSCRSTINKINSSKLANTIYQIYHFTKTQVAIQDLDLDQQTDQAQIH